MKILTGLSEQVICYENDNVQVSGCMSVPDFWGCSQLSRWLLTLMELNEPGLQICSDWAIYSSLQLPCHWFY